MIKIKVFKVESSYGVIPEPKAKLELIIEGNSPLEMERVQQKICSILCSVLSMPPFSVEKI